MVLRSSLRLHRSATTSTFGAFGVSLLGERPLAAPPRAASKVAKRFITGSVVISKHRGSVPVRESVLVLFVACARSEMVAPDDCGGSLAATITPNWRNSVAFTIVAVVLLVAGKPHSAVIMLAAAARQGPLNWVVRYLPEVRSLDDFDDRHYRVFQSIWLVSVCCGIYTLIPEERREGPNQGWKINLVTMETSMSSGIAATYGYSVAGGIPGGLLAEYVATVLGSLARAELATLLGEDRSRAAVGFFLFYVMGTYMDWAAIVAYAFAHQKRLPRALRAAATRAEETKPRLQAPAPAGLGSKPLATTPRGGSPPTSRPHLD